MEYVILGELEHWCGDLGIGVQSIMPVFQRTHAVLGCETCIKVSDCTQLSWLDTHTPLPLVRRHEAPRGPRFTRGVCRQSQQRELQARNGLSGFRWLWHFPLCCGYEALSKQTCKLFAAFCNSLWRNGALVSTLVIPQRCLLAFMVRFWMLSALNFTKLFFYKRTRAPNVSCVCEDRGWVSTGPAAICEKKNALSLAWKQRWHSNV